MYFAYDTPDDYEPLLQAGRYLMSTGLKRESQIARCYVLIGYNGDTFENALLRLRQVWEAGFLPMAMLYRDYSGNYDIEWKRFARQWANPIIRGAKIKKNDFLIGI
jgi:hypothetical protein